MAGNLGNWSARMKEEKMINKERKLRLKKLDVLYIVHNPIDCLIIYFCLCFTFIRIVYDLVDITASVGNSYIIASLFTICMGLIMTAWARRTFKDLKLKEVI